MLRCMNCGLNVEKRKRYAVCELELLLQNILAQWLSLPKVPDGDFICIACFALLNNSAQEENPMRKLGHLNVCIGCGCSTLNQRRSRTLDENSPFLEIYVPAPYHLKHQGYQVCFKCWMNGHRKLVKQIKNEIIIPEPVFAEQLPTLIEQGGSIDEKPSINPVIEEFIIPIENRISMENVKFSDPLTEQRDSRVRQSHTPSESIVLDQYKRASTTESRCIYNECKSKSRNLVPKFMKIMCLKKYNFYIPKRARVCEKHILHDTWELLPTMPNVSSVFNADQVEDLISLAKTELSLDFEDVHTMPDHICDYWTGYNVAEFTALYNEHKEIFDQCGKHPKTCLAAYLTRMRTGDTHERLAKLFQLSRTSLERRMNMVKNFVEKNNIQLKRPTHNRITKPI